MYIRVKHFLSIGCLKREIVEGIRSPTQPNIELTSETPVEKGVYKEAKPVSSKFGESCRRNRNL